MVEPLRSKKGLIAVICGEGKGKTTSAFGQAVRAAGHGWKVGIFQFLKDVNTGEFHTVSKNLPGIDIYAFGPTGRVTFNSNKTEEDRIRAEEGWRYLEQAAPGYDLLLIDELLPAIDMGLVQKEKVLKWLDCKPGHLDVFITGRYVPEEIARRAHLISRIQQEKHWYRDMGIIAREGIEF